MNKPIIEVAIAIIFHEGRCLISRRRGAVHLPDRWEFPGGKRLPDETLEACLLREIEEELGVTIKIDRAALEMDHDYPDRKILLHSYLCRMVSGVPKPLASQEVKWVLPEELSSYPFPEANRPLLDALGSGGRLR